MEDTVKKKVNIVPIVILAAVSGLVAYWVGSHMYYGCSDLLRVCVAVVKP